MKKMVIILIVIVMMLALASCTVQEEQGSFIISKPEINIDVEKLSKQVDVMFTYVLAYMDYGKEAAEFMACTVAEIDRHDWIIEYDYTPYDHIEMTIIVPGTDYFCKVDIAKNI